ncbi:MAG: hypothetical protein HY686_02860 [Chloroflexi bacterium]|nr:hypothetical protein [Chloroflexota bacterium]
MKLLDFDFEGPFTNLDDIRDDPGVYVILSMLPDRHFLLDVGETGYNWPRGGQGLRRRLKGHDRRPCWEQNSQGGAFAVVVLYESDDRRRGEIEDELRWRFEPPCGGDAWKVNPEFAEEMLRKFGPQRKASPNTRPRS